MILTLVMIAAAVSSPPASPTLCIDGTCRPVLVAITPAESARPFVLISADGTEMTVGTLAAGANAIPSPDRPLTGDRVTIATSDGARDVVIEYDLRCGDRSWSWRSPRISRQPVTIRRDADQCTIALRANGYKSIERKLAGGDLGSVYLQKLPTISGTVTHALNATPIAGAEVLLPDGQSMAITDSAGRFHFVVSNDWPTALRIAAPGLAPRIVSVPKLTADTHLPIALSPGGSISLTLAPPLGDEEVGWEVTRRTSDSRDESVRTGRIPAGQTSAVIDGLEPATYQVVISGEQPLQRFGVRVRVVDGGIAEAAVAITPAALDLNVQLDGIPLGGATVQVRFGEGMWRSSITTDTEGRAVEEIWQRGEYRASVMHAPLVRLWPARRRIETDGKHEWTISIADRKIRGRVTDESTGSPLSGVRLLLQSRVGDGSATVMPAQSAADGTFEFTTVPEGVYALRATKDGYRSLQTPDIPLVAQTTVEIRDIALRPAAARQLRVTNAHGAPIPAATVYVATARGVRMAGATDGEGKLTLTVEPGDGGRVFVIPRSGSLGIARFAPTAEVPGEIALRVPEGSSSLDVRAESTDGAPIAGLSLLMRIDGVLLPVDVREAMTHVQGVPLSTDREGRLSFPRLPPGRYEIWPLTTREDLRAVASAAPPPAPVVIVLTPGPHSATLKFKPRN